MFRIRSSALEYGFKPNRDHYIYNIKYFVLIHQKKNFVMRAIFVEDIGYYLGIHSKYELLLNGNTIRGVHRIPLEEQLRVL